VGAFFLMFALGVIGGCLLEARHRKVSASDDVREGLGLRVVGTIPALPITARKKSMSALSQSGLESRYGLTEAVDSVRTTLLHSRHADGARIVMITSALTGEGKTTLASHLAASLARAWRKTLIIDADLRNPNVHEQFDLPAGPGLCEALRGEVEFEDVIKPTMLGRLWMMSAGQVDAHALQALTQDGLAAVFDRLKDQFDFIVIDTSPVVPVPDALMLGKHADAVVLSVMKDISCMPAVYAAQQKLEDLGIRVLGAVVIGEKTESYGRPVPYGPIQGA
jgi:capsular exopolysaccharide synthesis family protein